MVDMVEHTYMYASQNEVVKCFPKNVDKKGILLILICCVNLFSFQI